MKFTITYNHKVYKPSSLTVFERQQAFKLIIEADDLTEAEDILRTEYNKNPFYFNITLT
tara:strand:- start:283 stop:459 length:177 start_codon:yes stop_codon:yes gene_type:complete